MENLMGKVLEKPLIASSVYTFFRIATGFLFLSHGLQKIFGAFGGVGGSGQGVPEIFSLSGLAGMVELAVGLAVVFGIFTRLFASIAVIEMAAAYCIAHAPKGFYPIENGGTLALMYLLAFLIIAVYGAGKLSLEKMMSGKEIF